MSIIVTSGETSLINAFADAEINITVENLLVGDVHIRKDSETMYIIERKAKGDLEASIKDKRYREQKGRLFETGIPRNRIIYLIENLSKPSLKFHSQVWGAICNTQHRDGIRVFQTKNLNQSVNYLVALAKSVTKHTQCIDSEPSKTVNINIKKRQVTTNDWFKYSLTLVPKCSLGIAEVIVDQYPTVRELINAINESGPECLADLKHGNYQRRIGKMLSIRVSETVLANY